MDWVVIVSSGILLLGLILFFILASKRDYREHSKAVEHFKDARDQLAEVEPEEEEEEQSSGGGFSLGGLISSMIGLIVVVSVGLPVISQVKDQVCSNTMNISTAMNQCGGAVGTVLDMLPIFLALAALVTVASLFMR